MTKHDETSKGKQLAEYYAVRIMGIVDQVDNCLDPIKWILERKVIFSDSKHLTMRFLFSSEKPWHMLKVVVVELEFTEKWKLHLATLESEYNPYAPKKRKWILSPADDVQEVE